MMQRLQPKLGVDTGAHRIGRTDQETHRAGAHVAEQALLRLGLLVILHESDFRCRHTHADELIANPAVGGEAPGFLDADRAEIGEDHLGGAGKLKRLAVRTHVIVLRRLLPDAEGVRDEIVELVLQLIVIVASTRRRSMPHGGRQ
ncbi:hypothetical protein ABIB95_008738 [Bradyrhizobium sp. LA2.1]